MRKAETQQLPLHQLTGDFTTAGWLVMKEMMRAALSSPHAVLPSGYTGDWLAPKQHKCICLTVWGRWENPELGAEIAQGLFLLCHTMIEGHEQDKNKEGGMTNSP